MLNEFLMQMRPYFGKEEREALLQYQYEDGFLTEFKETKKFENELATILGVKETCAVNNGTIAISVAALAVGVKSGDEVLVPNFTMVASANAIQLLGAKPIFVDIEPNTWCIDRNDLLAKLTDKTKAVVLVSANGRYPSYSVDELTQFLNARGIFLIEDAAQSLGSTYNDGRAIGTKGNVATLSFSAPKIISTGQGGLVFSTDQEISEKLKKIKDFGRIGGGSDFHPTFGINAKFTDLQAIVGLAQLQKLNSRIARRKEQTQLFHELLNGTPEISLPEWDKINNAPWFTEILTAKRDELALFLKQKNIGTRQVYPQLSKQPIYDQDTKHLNSEYVSDHGLWLPSHMGVTDEHIMLICDLIKEFYRRK